MEGLTVVDGHRVGVGVCGLPPSEDQIPSPKVLEYPRTNNACTDTFLAFPAESPMLPSDCHYHNHAIQRNGP